MNLTFGGIHKFLIKNVKWRSMTALINVECQIRLVILLGVQGHLMFFTKTKRFGENNSAVPLQFEMLTPWSQKKHCDN